MKYIFFGTPRFAEIVLSKLLDAGILPTALVCNPDKPVGRKKILTPPLTKQLIQERELTEKIKILQPEKIDENFLSQLQELNADVFIVAAYTKILPKSALDIPPKGVIGVHPSLLPKYRGAAPIQSAILNGEKETGTTLFLVGEGMDDGPTIASQNVKITEDDTTFSLTGKLAEISGNLLTKFILPNLTSSEDVRLVGRKQNEEEATFTKKIKTENAFIHIDDIKQAEAGLPASDAEESLEKTQEINRKIRAFFPEPGAYTIKDKKRIKLLESKIEDGKLILTKIQYEGKKPQRINPNFKIQMSNQIQNPND